ncbi:hypothetical protein HZ326_15847 [Fusarium oxysporum f. sp. albedinis]|nr:hypothetical protein HZ326_15847 [Fusarium oxysporum f. sp. albedinis]
MSCGAHASMDPAATANRNPTTAGLNLFIFRSIVVNTARITYSEALCMCSFSFCNMSGPIMRLHAAGATLGHCLKRFGYPEQLLPDN